MQTTSNPTATEARKAHFANIDQLLADLAAGVDALHAKCDTLAPTSWAYTGRGAELADLEIRLAEALELVR